jgi:hypothetical protein
MSSDVRFFGSAVYLAIPDSYEPGISLLTSYNRIHSYYRFLRVYPYLEALYCFRMTQVRIGVEQQ